MKTRSIILCALVLLTTSPLLFAQKTEVAVRKGKVRAETQNKSVNIDAGQKVVLTKDANPFVTVDSPLVRDALELYKLIEKEKQHSDLRIDSVFILVGKATRDEINGAIYFEVPNPSPKATNVMAIPYSSTLGDFRVYDLDGNLCRVEEKSLGDFAYAYSIYLPKEVQPGEHFKVIGVTRLDELPFFPGGEPAYWREGPLLYFRAGNGSPNALQYYRYIMPESAILIDSNREIVATDSVEGKPAVTMRNYTGPYSDALCMIAMLYPDEDGTTLADIPGKYHGLRSKRDKENAEMYQRQMHKIRAGMNYTDQSTPLAAFLTGFSGAINGDTELYKAVSLMTLSTDDARKSAENSKYWADQIDLLSTPQWPDNPGSGYVHPIYLCRKGSLIDEITQLMVYEDGKWYSLQGNFKEGMAEQATSEEIADATAKGYLCDWEIAGPYIRRGKMHIDKKHDELFDIPFGPELPDVDVPWQSVKLEPHEPHPVSVNIRSLLLRIDQSVAYLRTEIISDEQKPARLEIYTDDGVKAWLNGEVVHENNNSRGIQEQPDAVDVTLNQGVNRLMLKVTRHLGLASHCTSR